MHGLRRSGAGHVCFRSSSMSSTSSASFHQWQGNLCPGWVQELDLDSRRGRADEFVTHEPPVALDRHDACLPHDLEMMRDVRKLSLRELGEFGNGLLPRGESANESCSGWLAER